MTDRILLANVRQLPAGRVEVQARAIATVAAQAVTHCYGVVGMASRNLRESVVHVLNLEDQYKGIDVHISAEQVTIDLYVVLAYGTRIATVARNIMEQVQYAVEQALGTTTTMVNVHVQGLRFELNGNDDDSTLSRWRRFGTRGGLRGQRHDDSND